MQAEEDILPPPFPRKKWAKPQERKSHSVKYMQID